MPTGARRLAAGQPPRYAGTCRDLPRDETRQRMEAGERPVIRFRVPESIDVTFNDLVRGDVTFSSEVIGDPVLVRSDGRPAYNFAVVVDDALMEITHVIRGEDHISNTPRQVLLYQALGFEPPQFAHLSLVMGPDHTPLSKRHGATSVAEFRERGYLPEALVNYLALIGWSPGGERGAVADPGAGEPLRARGRGAQRRRVRPGEAGLDEPPLHEGGRARRGWRPRSMRYFLRSGFVQQRTDASVEYVGSLLPLTVASVDRLEEIPDRVRFIFAFDAAEALARPEVAAVVEEPGAREVIAALRRGDRGPLLDREAFRAMANRVKEKTGMKGKALFHPIRAALTGETGGPELDLAVPAIDRGSLLPSSARVSPIMSCRERATAFAVPSPGSPPVGPTFRSGVFV